MSENMKMEKDYSTTVDELIPATEKLAISGNLGQALDQLLILEKQSRSVTFLVPLTVKGCRHGV
jgi:26S proteasome regulatory subunit N5